MLYDKRLIGVDILRGVALVLMIIYHFCFDLVNFGYFSANLNQLLFWQLFRYIIVGLFLFLMGISLILAHTKYIRRHKVLRQVLRLSLASLLVSIGSWVQFPQTWIYFGILHFILVAYLLSLWLVNKPRLTLLLAVIILPMSQFGYLDTTPLFNVLSPVLSLPEYTQDLVPLFPWLAAVFLGMVFAKMSLCKKIFSALIWDRKTKIAQFLSYLGRKSLLVYLIHQPILFGLFFVVQM